MHRFFCGLKDISADKITISDQEQLHHIRDVLRIKKGEKVIICDQIGREYECLLDNASDKAIFKIIQARPGNAKKQKIQLTLACAIPKKCKFDDIVDKLTQLGVDRIIPLFTERVIVKWNKQKKLIQQKRWEKIALNVAQQSQRAILPVIEPVRNIKEALVDTSGYDLKLIPVLIDERKMLKDVLAQSSPKNVLVFIGPEGDFTPDEVALAKESGFIPITLGDNVLRVDTAAVATASFIRLYEDR